MTPSARHSPMIVPTGAAVSCHWIGLAPRPRLRNDGLRRIEWDGIYAAQEAFRNATPGLKGRALPGPLSLEQIPALAERGRLRLQHFFAWLDARLANNEFVSGPGFTIADISGMVAVDFSAWAKLRPPEHLGHLQRWYKDVSTRPSAKA
jgi:glutathione S-transferase